MPLPTSSPETRPLDAALDRSAVERDGTDLLDTLRSAADTRVLAVRRDAAPVLDGRLHLLDVAGVGQPLAWAFLGRTSDGAALLLAALDDDADVDGMPDAVWTALRTGGGDLPVVEAEVFTTAVALAGWLRDAPFCPACGTLAEVRHAGWSRHCPSCGREHFPRTDPAVIVLVTSEDDRVLLGANAAWGGSRYSCFAGFAEAGESLEDAVEREVGEEAGVRLSGVVYRGSQAWPYPRSLMLGFRARVVDEAEARPDGEEIVEVRWFDREEIGSALRGEGPVQLPGPASIARRLIDDWARGVA
ncbi:NAD(+) diphosphatase [Microbacterium trichothecenolyticum]|uniref:NAD(+) diphosphatase n=1 Tax=Microbacterium trichothecenolyticum TaxID=69370 RepID=A0ABU0TQ58_MICTR|nr:NAD(+) diphosphatase [Microbacterium trichothecenolyticum]MDQ1121806.1 NAD+ diphosphatase [Microbacterium trichothecenolyticum]